MTASSSSRDGDTVLPGATTLVWNARDLGPWVREIDGADAIVHLSGRRVDVRPTRRAVDDLIRSRVQPVRVVGQALARCRDPAPVWIQAGSLAVFGDTGDELIDESSTGSGTGPREMVGVCLAWESAFARATEGVRRPVLLRFGIGFGGRGDPATEKLARLARVGLGGRAGTGRQWVSWVSLHDQVSAVVRAIDDATMRGTYHVTSPNPVRNAELMAAFRRAVGRRFGLACPAPLVHIGSPLVGSGAASVLTGRRCVPTRLIDEGFAFAHPDLDPVVAAAVAAALR